MKRIRTSDGFISGFRRRCGIAAILAAFLVLPAASAWAEVDRPREKDNQITFIVSSLLKNQHLSKHPLDEEISERGFDLFLKQFDPNKLYFTKADVEEFRPHSRTLHKTVLRGDISFAYSVFNRFLKRVDERVALVRELLAEEHDFSVSESYPANRKNADYLSDPAEIRDIWRRRVKLDLLVQKADKKSLEEAKKTVQRRYDLIGRRWHQTNGDDLLETYLSSMTMAFDPHTTYMSPSAYENFQIQMRLELDGIGAALQTDDDGSSLVTKIIPGGAADKAGQLKPKDKVIGVGQGADGEIVDIIDMRINDVVNLIRGKAGTTVRLKVLPAGSTEVKIYDIVRAKIELTDSEARGQVIEEGRKPDNSKYKVGYIDLPSFYMDMQGAREGKPMFKSTTRDVKRILDDFNRQGVDAVILDLRKNGGGSLTEAINLTGLFIDKGPVVQVKDPEGRVQVYDDTEAGVAWDGPLVVLTSKLSASASEIFAGAIQDYRRGLVVGDKTTHGKGTVQTLMDLSQIMRFGNKLGALKLTIQKFYRPGGDSTQERGVVADIELPSVTTHMDIGEADLDHALAFDTVPGAEFAKLNYVSEAIVRKLEEASVARRASSDEFTKAQADIERYRMLKANKVIPLNEREYLEQRGDEVEPKNLFGDDEESSKNGEIVRRDYWFNESLAITIDYARALSEFAVSAVDRKN